MTVLNTSTYEIPTWVSADDCVLYFHRSSASGFSGGYDLFVAVRGQ
jgi:hypothetical protein